MQKFERLKEVDECPADTCLFVFWITLTIAHNVVGDLIQINPWLSK